MESSENKAGYVDISRERRAILGKMIEDHAKKGEIKSIQEMCAVMHDECQSISEALFVGAFIDFYMADNREERVNKIKEKLASTLTGAILGEVLSKAFNSRSEAEKAKDEDQKAKEEALTT